MIQGNCTGDSNPDYWYPEIPIGRPSAQFVERLTRETEYALKLCSACPVKDTCLAEGMKTETVRGTIEAWGNLPFGIWGGTLPHERLQMVGITRQSSSGWAVRQAYRLSDILGTLLRR